jgi:hypothetical protein
MNRNEALAFVGQKVRGSLIDAVSACRGPVDGRIYLMSQGERVVEVSQLDQYHVTHLGTVRVHTKGGLSQGIKGLGISDPR